MKDPLKDPLKASHQFKSMVPQFSEYLTMPGGL